MRPEDICDHPDAYDLSVQTLGPCRLTNPLRGQRFVRDEERISLSTDAARITEMARSGRVLPAFERAGPRQQIFHDPARTRAAVVTCGGLAPGLNAVLKGLVQVLYFDYGVRDILGIPYGYRGLNPRYGFAPMPLTPSLVDTSHAEGGSLIATSRGNQDPAVMVDTLLELGVGVLFTVGGDGTLRGAHALAQEVRRRGAPISVIGIPKTVDNDLNLIDRTFGFETAVFEAAEVITRAHVEAKGVYNGLGIVKLMGRDSGFIAAYATLANTVVNFCLIPEVPLTLEGDSGLLAALDRRFAHGKTHAVLVVAEGAGQHLFGSAERRKDASGNLLHHDIGELLVNRVKAHAGASGREINVKYFDPNYTVRSVPARGTDAIFCYQLAENAVHAAMAGKTDMVVGAWVNRITHVPIALATAERKHVDVNGALWHAVLSATRQDDYFLGRC